MYAATVLLVITLLVNVVGTYIVQFTASELEGEKV
jgi:ABC-type phosphate transport system permease subunit